MKYLKLYEDNIDDINFEEDWEEEEVISTIKPKHLSEIEVGDRASVPRYQLRLVNYPQIGWYPGNGSNDNNEYGIVIAKSTFNGVCVEFDNPIGGHKGNSVSDIDNNNVDFGKNGHCWWCQLDIVTIYKDN